MIKVAEGFQASQQMGQKFDAEFYRIDDGVDERFVYQISKALILNQRTRLLRNLNHSGHALRNPFPQAHSRSSLGRWKTRSTLIRNWHYRRLRGKISLDYARVESIMQA